jgi:hypothetical protein
MEQIVVLVLLYSKRIDEKRPFFHSVQTTTKKRLNTKFHENVKIKKRPINFQMLLFSVLLFNNDNK